MKRFFRYIYLCVLSSMIFTVVSCEDLKFGNEFLQKPPSSDVTIDTVFSTAEYARRVLWLSYQDLHYGLSKDGYNLMRYVGNDALTDLCQCAITYSHAVTNYYYNKYNAGIQQTDANFVNCPYKGNEWKAVRNAWLFIEHVDDVPDMDDAEKNRMKAEAKTLIATHYSYLFRNFGALPILDHALNSQDIMPARATLQETVDFMVRLLDEAIDCSDFPWRISDEEMDMYHGRLTKASAMGLKARVLLFAASPLFNSDEPYYPGEASDKKMTWFGNYDVKRWELAANACKEFFDELNRNGYYELVSKDVAASIYPGYENDFRCAFRAAYYDRGTTESLISVHSNVFTTSSLGGTDQGLRWGGFNPTAEYLDMFPTANGTMLDWESERAAGKNIFENRDPRFYETFVVHGDIYRGEVIDFTNPSPEIYNPDVDKYPVGPIFKAPKKYAFSDNSLASGFGTRKWGLDRTGHGMWNNHIIQWPFLRLAEIYLSYAEALNECGRTKDAYQWVDAVRARVGMKGLEKNLSKEEFRAEVLRERACEFGWEEVRWYDLVRWKMKEKFTTPLHGLYTMKAKDSDVYEYKRFDFRGVSKTARTWWKKDIFKERLYLSAFPADEVRKGYGLVQNPGWE